MPVKITRIPRAAAVAEALATGLKKADESMHHADSVVPGWIESAEDFGRRFAKGHHKPFPSEVMQHWAENRGCPYPPDKRAWGGIMKRLQKDGIIVPYVIDGKCEFVRSQYRHGTWVMLWVSA